MPGGDGTGPAGMGPMTGRAAGYCAGYPIAGYMNPAGGRPFGFGRGFGRGRSRGYYGAAPYGATPYAAAPYGAAPYATAPWAGYADPYTGAPAPEQEITALKRHAEALSAALDAVRARIGKVEKTEKS